MSRQVKNFFVFDISVKPNELIFVWICFKCLCLSTLCRSFQTIFNVPTQPDNFTNNLPKFDLFFFCLFLPISFTSSFSFFLSFSLLTNGNTKSVRMCCDFFPCPSRSTLSFLVWKFVFKSALSRQRLRFEQQKNGNHQRCLRIDEAAAALLGWMGKVHSRFQWTATWRPGNFIA